MSSRALRDRLARARAEISRPRDLILAVRIAVWTIVVQGLKHVVPLPALVRLMRCDARRTGTATSETQIVALCRWASRAISSRGRGRCLERGLVTYRYLCAIGANPQLVIGVSRNDRGAITGHAWVVVDERPLDEGPDSLDGFHTVGTFGPDGLRVHTGEQEVG
jgi:hypothetical protein